ncbi:MAG: chemotaxis protein CheR [Deltaproteobacteria bacterium]|nr:chemotaxis protein CheR [Deltaproteobacteria bacterium]
MSLSTLHAIRDHVIPELRTNRYINVWDAGCAMGPEPYSLAIIFREALGYYGFRRLKIYATDLDEESHRFGETIAEGVYPEEAIKRIPPDIFRRYFLPDERPGCFRISEEIMRSVCFQKHDLRTFEPIRDGFGLIVCKNVLLHLSESERIGVIRMFHRSLVPGGFFATEQTQGMPGQLAHLFSHVIPNVQLFRKN